MLAAHRNTCRLLNGAISHASGVRLTSGPIPAALPARATYPPRVLPPRRYGLLEEESEAVIHQWRYAGYLMGVTSELLPATEREARLLWERSLATQGEPDEDSVRLTHALIQHPIQDAETPEERALSLSLKGVEPRFEVPHP